jgi:hypothetical protein
LALALLGFALIYAGAVLGSIGLSGAGCEWGDAQGLFAGLPALLSYAAGTVGLLAARPRRLAYLALLPAAPLLAQQALFAARLAIGVLGEGASACGVLLAAPMEPSGEEGFFLLLWLALVLVPVFGLGFAFRRAAG